MKAAAIVVAISLVLATGSVAPANAQDHHPKKHASASAGVCCDPVCMLQRKLNQTNRRLGKLEETVNGTKKIAGLHTRVTSLENQTTIDHSTLDKAVDEQGAQGKTMKRIGAMIAAIQKSQDMLFKILCVVILVLLILLFLLIRHRQGHVPAMDAPPADAEVGETISDQSTPLDEVRATLINSGDQSLEDGPKFKIHLISDGLVFEYTAKLEEDNVVHAFFKGNDRPIRLESSKLRRMAKRLFDQNKLEPVAIL